MEIEQAARIVAEKLLGYIVKDIDYEPRLIRETLDVAPLTYLCTGNGMLEVMEALEKMPVYIDISDVSDDPSEEWWCVVISQIDGNRDSRAVADTAPDALLLAAAQLTEGERVAELENEKK